MAEFSPKRSAESNLVLTQVLGIDACLKHLPCVSLRSTLLRWRKEILAYWYCRLTNARNEDFNNKAKLVKRRAYGFVSFRHYRLRLLNSCCG